MFKALSIALHKDSSFEVISEFCNFLEELNIHDLFPKDTPDEIMKYQMYLRIPVIYVLGIKEEDAVKGRSIFDVLEDLKVEIAADAKAKNLVDNVIKLSKAKNYSNEESLNILAEDEKEKWFEVFF